AAWAMDDNHRGAWPEISVEPTPAYFSPPAGLYVQACVEALFGLQLDRPAGVLQVSPSFPDAWPGATLALPAFRADYRRQGDCREYRIRSREPLRRRLSWHLPAGRVAELTVNGRAVPFRLSAWVDGMLLSAETGPATDSRIRLVLRPAPWRVEHPLAVAEGDPLPVRVTGAEVVRLDDRCGVLQSADRPRLAAGGGCSFGVTVRQGLLAGYAGYGRLGQLNFSRRTFFLLCRLPDGSQFWAPVDVTVLPRYEAAVRGDLTPSASGGEMELLLRNHTVAPLRGPAVFTAGRVQLTLEVDVPARAEREVRLTVPRDRLALLSPGDNRASLLLPSGAEVELSFSASELFARSPELGAWAAGRMAPVALPEAVLRPDTTWREWREFTAYGHWPWAGSKPPLEALGEARELSLPDLPGVRFALPGRKLAVASYRSGTPSLTVPLNGETSRKLYLLVLPLLDNHDTFTQVGRVDVTTNDGAVLSRALRFPGDLDWWCPESVVGQFATASQPRPDRLGLLPRLAPGQADWPEGRPPAFPQPAYWATCRAVKTASAVLNVVELDLGQPLALRELTLAAVGAEPALGLVAVSLERASGHNALAGTGWLPPPELREPTPLFRLDRPADLAGWELEGEAFAVAPVPSLFTTPTLNSLARGGESAVGVARSPVFTLDGRWLRFRYQGGHSHAADGPGALLVRLRDAVSGEVLAALEPPGTHLLQAAAIAVTKWQGRRVRLELLDQSRDPSYAWLGLTEVSLSWQ
ncbi:MAG: hypothetical protein HYU66_13215, partial [Armatimonadetes bacterium]|nr:hypothetical protein [Armatimonadota bacterium]